MAGQKDLPFVKKIIDRPKLSVVVTSHHHELPEGWKPTTLGRFLLRLGTGNEIGWCHTNADFWLLADLAKENGQSPDKEQSNYSSQHTENFSSSLHGRGMVNR